MKRMQNCVLCTISGRGWREFGGGGQEGCFCRCLTIVGVRHRGLRMGGEEFII